MHKDVGAAIVWGDEARIILAPTLIRQQADRASDIACLAEAISVQTNLPFGCAPRQGRRNFVRDGESAHNIWAPIHKSRRISPRRVERIVCQVIGDRAGVMTDALTRAGTFHGIGAELLCDYAPRTVRADIMFDERNMGRGSPHAKK